MKTRIRFVAATLLLGVALTAAAVPLIAAAQSQPAISIHEGGDPTSWGYTPTNMTVAVGQTVTWTNAGAFPHDAAATDGSWKTQLLDPGASGSVTFTTPGTYAYICTPHPWMQATIVVNAAAPTPAPTPVPADTGASQAPGTGAAPQGDTTSAQPASNPAPDPGSDDGN